MSAQVGYGGFSAWLQGLLAQWKAEGLSDAAAQLFLNISCSFGLLCHFHYQIYECVSDDFHYLFLRDKMKH